jgi:peptide/nickel transport system substrate-binding protein
VRRVAVIAIVCLLCIFPGCSQSTRPSTTSERGTLRIGMVAEPNSLNPLLIDLDEEVIIDNLLFDPLLAFGLHGEAEPVLAAEVPTLQNGGLSKDGLTIVYHLRPNARWQDGYPVTSRDVVFSFNAVMNPKNDVSIRYAYDAVSRVEALDNHTVAFHLKRRYAPAFTSIFGQGPAGYVVPQHLLAKYADVNHLGFNANPVGDGAFRIVSWRRGESIELAANDRYYRGPPKLRRIIIRFIRDDNTALLMLESHEIDVLLGPSVSVFQRLQALRGAGFETVLTPTNGWNGIALNISHQPLNDRRVRQAIAFAIDKHEIVHNVLHDAQSQATGEIPRDSWAYTEPTLTHRHDLARAQSLLREAGWGNRRMRLELAFNEASATDRAEAVLLQSDLANAGIDLEVKGYPQSLLYATVGQGGVVETGSFDLAIEHNKYHSGEPDNSIYYSCSAIDPNGYNDARYCNGEVDRLERYALATYDRRLRKEAYAKIESLIARDVPYLFIKWQNEIVASKGHFYGWQPENFELSIANAQTWSN